MLLLFFFLLLILNLQKKRSLVERLFYFFCIVSTSNVFPIFTCILSKETPLRLNRGDKNGKRQQTIYHSV